MAPAGQTTKSKRSKSPNTSLSLRIRNIQTSDWEQQQKHVGKDTNECHLKRFDDGEVIVVVVFFRSDFACSVAFEMQNMKPEATPCVPGKHYWLPREPSRAIVHPGSRKGKCEGCKENGADWAAVLF